MMNFLVVREWAASERCTLFVHFSKILWVAYMATIMQHFFTLSLPSYETTLHSWRVKEKRILSSQENLYIYKQFWYAISWTLPCEYRKADHQSAELKKKMHTNLSWARVLGAAGFVRHNRSDTCYKHMWSIYIKILTWTTKKFRTSLSCLVPASARLRSHRRFEMEQAHSNNKQI